MHTLTKGVAEAVISFVRGVAASLIQLASTTKTRNVPPYATVVADGPVACRARCSPC